MNAMCGIEIEFIGWGLSRPFRALDDWLELSQGVALGCRIAGFQPWARRELN
jgi:hypothetical protein